MEICKKCNAKLKQPLAHTQDRCATRMWRKKMKDLNYVPSNAVTRYCKTIGIPIFDRTKNTEIIFSGKSLSLAQYWVPEWCAKVFEEIKKHTNHKGIKHLILHMCSLHPDKINIFLVVMKLDKLRGAANLLQSFSKGCCRKGGMAFGKLKKYLTSTK